MADLLLKAPIQYEPLTKNRWTLRFPDDIGIQTFMLKSCDTPKPNINTNEMRFINTSTFTMGYVKWDAMNITIRDFIAPSSSQALMEWFRLHHEALTGRSGYAVGYKKTLQLELLDPVGVVVSAWRCEDCMLSGPIDFGALSYDDDNVKEITFTVQPDRCEQPF